MYRSRLDNIDDITLDYVSSINDDSSIIQYDILGSQAHVIMLYEQKLLTKSETRKILLALKTLKIDTSHNAEDIHELIEVLVIKKTGMSSGGKMHTARSRNDQIVLDMRMKIRDDINIISTYTLNMIEEILSLAKLHKKTIMPLYTHLQQAQVGLFSHYLLAQADVLFRDVKRLHSTFTTVNENPLGAGPVGGTSIPINRKRTSTLLGFDGIVENSLDATSTRDFVAEYVSTISILMTNLSRIAEDFVIWSSTEFAFIELADKFASPSSVMPQKKNPDILELTRGKTAEIIGNLTSILVTIKGLSSGYGRDLQQIKPAIWSTSKTAINALFIMKSILQTIHINEENMRQAVESGYLIALDIAETLVQKNIPFRVAHGISGQLVQQANKERKTLQELTIPEITDIANNYKTDPNIITDIINDITITSSLKNRVSLGSSGYKEQDRMIKNRTKKLDKYRKDTAKMHKKIADALENLSVEIQKLV